MTPCPRDGCRSALPARRRRSGPRSGQTRTASRGDRDRAGIARQRPQRSDDVTAQWRQRSDGSRVYILKDTIHFRYFQLSEQGAFVWELMDGQHSVRDFVVAYYKHFGQLGFSAVMNCMISLVAAGFIRI